MLSAVLARSKRISRPPPLVSRELVLSFYCLPKRHHKVEAGLLARGADGQRTLMGLCDLRRNVET